jgi:nucleotide-binding universal stress UspA family protein
MGTQGHGFLEDVLLGSTARRVIRRSKKPVLVVRLPEEEIE